MVISRLETIKAVILAGGRGERLKPITKKIQKVMVKVKGRPVLEHNLVYLQKYGIKNFIFSLCYLPNSVISYFSNGSRFGVKINYIIEKTDCPMGTAGALCAARKQLKSTFIVTYGDILRDLDIEEMINFHRKTGSIATLSVYRNFSPDPKSMIDFDSNFKVTRFTERPKDKKKIGEIWSNASFYILEPEIFDFIACRVKSDFGKDVFPKILSSKKKISAFVTKGYFVDIGEIGKLSYARKTFKPFFSIKDDLLSHAG